MKRTLAIVLLLSISSLAHAQQISEEKDYSSPRNFAFEIKLGPYMPNVDNEFSVKPGPYELVFENASALMVSAELDYQIWKGFGSIGIGLSFGYGSVSAFALDETDETKRTEGKTSISLFPISLLAVYRFDVLATHWDIPFVPFAKVGLNYTIWQSGNSSGDVTGGSFGWQANLGAALLLDILEPGAAKNLDSELGINHTYLFFEFVHAQVDNFGAEKALHVGDTTWQGGLAFEF